MIIIIKYILIICILILLLGWNSLRSETSPHNSSHSRYLHHHYMYLIGWRNRFCGIGPGLLNVFRYHLQRKIKEDRKSLPPDAFGGRCWTNVERMLGWLVARKWSQFGKSGGQGGDRVNALCLSTFLMSTPISVLCPCGNNKHIFFLNHAFLKYAKWIREIAITRDRTTVVTTGFIGNMSTATVRRLLYKLKLQLMKYFLDILIFFSLYAETMIAFWPWSFFQRGVPEQFQCEIKTKLWTQLV